MKRGVVLVGGTLVVVAIGLALAPTLWPADDKNEWSDYKSPPYTSIEVGETYNFVVSSPHCDVTQGLIDGTNWRADPPIPSAEWTGSAVGRLRIVDTDTAAFVNDQGDKATFVRDTLPGVACA
ncbi:MAG: hypothetical protein ACJ739_11210 [Acidimicrobiales bacterium]